MPFRRCAAFAQRSRRYSKPLSTTGTLRRTRLIESAVFDVPSADILDKGKVYGELDGTVRAVDPLATFTPRVVVGVGHQIEIGMNFDGLSAPALDQLEISPTVKMAALEGQDLGMVFLRWR